MKQVEAIFGNILSSSEHVYLQINSFNDFLKNINALLNLHLKSFMI